MDSDDNAVYYFSLKCCIKFANTFLNSLNYAKRVNSPTLIINGINDKILNIEKSRVLLESLAVKDKEWKTFSSSHTLHLDDHTEEIAKYISKWIFCRAH